MYDANAHEILVFASPETRRTPQTGPSVQDEILRVAAAQVAVETLTSHEAQQLGADGIRRMVKEIGYDVQTARLAAYAS